MDIIRLRNMVFYGHHGALREERAVGSRFEVDLDMQVDLARPSTSDRLNESVDYQKVYQSVRHVVEHSRFHLLEKLAAAIVDTVLEDFPVAEATVRLRKPHAPIQGIVDCVEVELSRKSREET